MKEVIEHLERMAETLDGVDDENWLDTPQDIAQIYRSVANEIRDKMSAQNQSVTNCNQLQPNKVENTENNHIRLNAAKMREALEEFVKYSELVQRMGIFVRDSLVKITTKAHEALSAPPRNCDMLNTPDESFSSYCEEKGITKPLPLWLGNEFWEFLYWLFDEAKGEAK